MQFLLLAAPKAFRQLARWEPLRHIIRGSYYVWTPHHPVGSALNAAKWHGRWVYTEADTAYCNKFIRMSIHAVAVFSLTTGCLDPLVQILLVLVALACSKTVNQTPVLYM